MSFLVVMRFIGLEMVIEMADHHLVVFFITRLNLLSCVFLVCSIERLCLFGRNELLYDCLLFD